MRISPLSQNDVLFVSIALHDGTSRREDVDTRHIGQLFIEIEGLLHNQGSTTFAIA
jgi:hypothetical protein